jgi:pimeloyl-ACP methyl ester carboxylesterase
MANTVYIPVRDDHKLHGELTVPAEARFVRSLKDLLIIMVHGFPGHSDGHDQLYKDFSFLLEDKGYHSLKLDYTGCGKSDGNHEDFTLSQARADLKATLDWAQKKGYERFMFIGEGLGAVLPLTDHNDLASCFILLWPILDLKHAARHIFDADNIDAQWKQAGYLVHDNQRVNVSLVNELEHGDISEALRNVNKPIIVMHGAQDEVAPIDKLDMLREHTQSRRIEITSFQDGAHGLPKLNHRKAMHYHIMQFIEKYS